MGLKKLIKKYQEKQAGEKLRRTEIQSIKKEALHTARLSEAKTLAIQQAKFEREQQFKKMKGGGRKGIMGAVANRVNIAAENLGYAKGGVGGIFGTMGRAPTPTQPQVQTQKVKRTKKKKRKKAKIIHTKIPQQSYQPHNVFATSIRRSF